MVKFILDDEIALIKQDPYKYSEKVSINKLVEILKIFSDSYYNKSNPLVSDKVFDILYEQLAKKDPRNSFLKEVGSRPTNSKIKLPYVMPSLNKIKPDTNVLEEWKKKYPGPYVLSDKLDGVSALLYIKNGKIKMFTRGDMYTGQDISFLIDHVLKKKDKETLLKMEELGVRGELIISKTNFEKIKDKFKNARNTVAGLVNSKKNYSKEIADLTDFVAYSILYPNMTSELQIETLEKWKIPLVTNIIKKNNQLNNDLLSKYLVERRSSSPYEIDGIVVNDSSKIYDLEDKNPSHAFAFKMILNDQIAETRIMDVIWNCSRHGYLKPVVLVEPITLTGVTIKQATAFNAKFVVDNLIGPGSLIKLIRSGDVIPHILEVLEPSTSKKPKMPNVPFKWTNSGIDIIVEDFQGQCKNEILVKQLTSFLKTIDVKNISEGIVAKLVDNGYTNIFKLLEADRSKLYEIEGLGQKSIDKIYENIEDSIKNATLSDIMVASNIFGRGLGSKKINIILENYPDLLEIDKKKLRNDIINLYGFDNISTNQFIDNLDDFKSYFNKLEKIPLFKKNFKSKKPIVKKKTSNILNGHKIVFTGVRNKDLEDFIISNGGSLSTTVSNNTTILIYKKGSSETNSKYLKAKELEIELLTEDEFKKKYQK